MARVRGPMDLTSDPLNFFDILGVQPQTGIMSGSRVRGPQDFTPFPTPMANNTTVSRTPTGPMGMPQATNNIQQSTAEVAAAPAGAASLQQHLSISKFN